MLIGSFQNFGAVTMECKTRDIVIRQMSWVLLIKKAIINIFSKCVQYIGNSRGMHIFGRKEREK